MISMQETLVPLRAVPDHLPSEPDGTKPDVSSIYRWCRRGVNGRKLECLKLGKKIYTSLEALERFGQQPPTDEEMAEELSRQNQARHDADEAELERIGA